MEIKNASLGKNTTENMPLLEPDPLFNITIVKEAFFKRGIFLKEAFFFFKKMHFSSTGDRGVSRFLAKIEVGLVKNGRKVGFTVV